MLTNKYTLKATRQIVGGVKSVIAGVFALAGTGGKLTRDIRFWAEGRDWDFPLGPIYGEAGTTTTIDFCPQTYFRGEKLLMTDTAVDKDGKPQAGFGTSLCMVLVGQRLQRPATGGGTLSAFFGATALGNGLEWDECSPAGHIALTISFIKSCTFYGNLFGRALL